MACGFVSDIINGLHVIKSRLVYNHKQAEKTIIWQLWFLFVRGSRQLHQLLVRFSHF